uniref:Uncharacterized protein n=1 Tax=Anguilla anguilla TaxID=7936 RepID=A0A0E9QGW1_ANGAN
MLPGYPTYHFVGFLQLAKVTS